jgi:hypothetical protein
VRINQAKHRQSEKRREKNRRKEEGKKSQCADSYLCDGPFVPQVWIQLVIAREVGLGGDVADLEVEREVVAADQVLQHPHQENSFPT